MTQASPARTHRMSPFASVVRASFIASLLVFGWPVNAEPTETIAVPQDAVELGVYRQSFEVTADVLCRVPKKGPSYCNTNIGSEIAHQVQPEMIIKYKSVRLDEQEFAAEVTHQGTLQFRTNKVDYSGPQTFEVEIIYLK